MEVHDYVSAGLLWGQTDLGCSSYRCFSEYGTADSKFEAQKKCKAADLNLARVADDDMVNFLLSQNASYWLDLELKATSDFMTLDGMTYTEQLKCNCLYS